VIDLLNKEFIPLELNLSDKGWPETMPALWGWKLYHSVNPISKFGFTACAALTPDGKRELGNAGSAGAENWKTSAHYHGDAFVEFLEKSLAKYKTIKK
jgi:hypothetical protein